MRTYKDASTPGAIVIASDIDHTSSREIGKELEILTFQIGDRGLKQFVKVVWQDNGRQSHRNTLGTLSQQKRELDRQSNGFVVSSVVRLFPFRDFLIKGDIESEFRQTALDVSSCSGIVTSINVTPVTLSVNHQVFLPQQDQSARNRGIAMRVILHSSAHHVSDLVHTPVFHSAHSVQDAPLHRFQTVFNVWHSTVENNVRGIVEKPLFEHARQLVLHTIGIQVRGLIVGMCDRSIRIASIKAVVFLIFLLILVFFVVINREHTSSDIPY